MKEDDNHELVAASLEDGLLEKPNSTTEQLKPTTGSSRFLFWVLVNTLATIAIVFTNKTIFEDPSFKHMQISFASFHFACTTFTLYFASRPSLGMFVPRRAKFMEILPLSAAMCFNVILPNLSLSYSSVTFYQIARILLTPMVALINYIFYQTSIPRNALLALIPVCVGVGTVTYYDTLPPTDATVQTTSPIGVFFALTGVLASSVYTVWIGVFHKRLNMSSMQLLFNQAPWSSMMLWLFVPFIDVTPDWATVPMPRWATIFLSGFFASLINLSQFFIVANAGPTSSTIVGHAKTCSIVMLGWMLTGTRTPDMGLLGIVMAIAGISCYSMVMLKLRQKA
ncbi:hypothetical protein DFH27DRAFT_477788 [Peziza echinospora]|nr:hypothetical protein DFH27DRAFT_477788 [Peziza echinospora]